MPYARENVPLMFVIAITRICTCAQGSDAHWRPAHTVSRFSPSYPYELDRELGAGANTYLCTCMCVVLSVVVVPGYHVLRIVVDLCQCLA